VIPAPRSLRAGARRIELGCAPDLEREFLALLATAERSGPRFAVVARLAGREVYFKSYAFPGASRWRHFGRRALGAEAPCFREAANLAWLAGQGFAAPEPLAAGWVLELGVPRRQALATALVPDARGLDALLAAAGGRERAALARTIGDLAGRLHARGFVHRDLFLRNLVLDAAGRPWILDCRRGGRARPGRGFGYDLGALFLDGAAALDADGQRALLEAYFASRGACPRVIDRARLLGEAARARRALFARLERVDPRRAAGLPRAWLPPELGAA
jgi:hypothetical protein